MNVVHAESSTALQQRSDRKLDVYLVCAVDDWMLNRHKSLKMHYTSALLVLTYFGNTLCGFGCSRVDSCLVSVVTMTS